MKHKNYHRSRIASRNTHSGRTTKAGKQVSRSSRNRRRNFSPLTSARLVMGIAIIALFGGVTLVALLVAGANQAVYEKLLPYLGAALMLVLHFFFGNGNQGDKFS